MSNSSSEIRLVIAAPVPDPVDHDLLPRLELGRHGLEQNIERRRVGIGGPIAVPVPQSAEATEDLPVDEDFEFILLRLAVSFYPTQNEKLDAAAVGLSLLSLEEIPGLPKPVAWSLSPRQLTSASTSTTEVKLGLGLGLVTPEVKMVDDRRDEVFVRCFGELQSDPEWRFRRTRTQAIEGSHQFSVVVRRPSGLRCKVGVAVSCNVSRVGFGMLSYSLMLPPSYSSLVF